MSIVKSFSVGDGDMFYIAHNSDNFTVIDCCMFEDDKRQIVRELKSKSAGRGITRFISTHPDDDHISGLVYLHQQIDILNFYCVKNEATKTRGDETDDFDQYCELRDDVKKAFYLFRGCSRKWMNLEDEERKTSGLSVLWPDTNSELHKEALRQAKAGKSPNNISPIVTYSVGGGATLVWMGDLESIFMNEVKDEVAMKRADILFAPHHGRDSGTVPIEWLAEMDPKLIIIGEAPSMHLNYYVGYDTITQNSAGNITLDCQAGYTHVYVSNPDYSVDFLDDENISDTYGKYIGTLRTKE
jgi:beta-lactamase superfamily II metal-dependent hydrolase